MRTLIGTAALALSIGTAAFAAGPRHYDCTKPGNANKSACKAPVGAAATVTPAAPAAKATPAATPAKAARSYDCSKAGNKNKAACKTAVAAPPAALAPVNRPAPTAPSAPAPMARLAAAPAATPAVGATGGAPRIVPWTEKNGKVVHYDCSKAGNFNKKACKT